MERKIGQTQFSIKSEAEGKFSGKAMIYNIVDRQNDKDIPGMFSRTIRENDGKVRILGQHEPANAYIADELTRLIAREQIDAVRDGMIHVATRISTIEDQLKGLLR